MQKLASIFLIACIGLVLCAPGIGAVLRAEHPAWLPGGAFQWLTDLQTRKLYGIAETPANPTAEGWFNGAPQLRFEAWMKADFLVRRVALQLYNQAVYTFLWSPTSDQLAIGSSRQLYEMGYIRSACATYPVASDDEIKSIIARIEKAQAILQEHGVPFVLILTPSKAVTEPQDVPGRLCPDNQRAPTTYTRALPHLRQSQVNFVDGQSIALAAQRATGWPMFPLGGTHWTDYAALKTLSAAIDKMNSASVTPTPLPRIVMASASLDYHPKGVEDDILNLLNLFAPSRHYPVPHVVPSLEGTPRPLAISFVGDSFTNHLVDMMRRVGYANIDFFYYYSIVRATAASVNGPPVVYAQKECYDVKRLFEERSAVILETNVSFINGKHVNDFLDDFLRQSTPNAELSALTDGAHPL